MGKLKTQAVGLWFGDAHAWASEGLDKFIEERVKKAREEGEYVQVADGLTDEQIKHLLLREALYLMHAMFTSIEHAPGRGGLDAVRMARQEVRGRSPLIPPFRTLMADWLGLPNHFAQSDDPPDESEDGKKLVTDQDAETPDDHE